MAFVKKTWKDRLVQYPTRRTLTDIVSGDTQTVNVARAEGTVSEAGDAFSADNMNDLEDRIYQAIESGSGSGGLDTAHAEVIFANVISVEENVVPNPRVYNEEFRPTANKFYFTRFGQSANHDIGIEYLKMPTATQIMESTPGTKLLVFLFPQMSWGKSSWTVLCGDIFIEVYENEQGQSVYGEQYVVDMYYNIHTGSPDVTRGYPINLNECFVMGGYFNKYQSDPYIRCEPLGVLGNPFNNAGSEVTFTPILQSGTKIGSIEIDGVPTDIYAPTPIDVEANPSGQASNYLQKLKVGNGIYDIEHVSANVAVSTLAAPLTTLKINDDEYTVPSGGGTTVVANPSGTATDDLEKIQIGSTIYDIPSGGGGEQLYLSDYYSTEERVVGRWTDGKPLYQKTFDLGSSVSINNNTWYDTSFKPSDYDMEKVIAINTGLNDNTDINVWESLGAVANNTSDKISILNARAGSITIRYFTLQYTKTTDAPGTGPTAGNIIYLPALYSEEEREVGVFTDGKPLYQKTIDIGYLPSNSTKNVNHDIANIDKIVTVFGFAKDSTSAIDKTIPLPYANASSAGNQVQVEVYNTYIQIATKITAFSTYYGKVTIQYTKTTDTPGSGTWTPDGQLAHHYSTSEHIVGTWIDGSTLYERTWDFGSDLSCSANTWTVTTIPNSGMNLLVAADITSDNGMFRSAVQVGRDYGDYVRIRPIGDAINARYVTLQYTKA